jgi:transcriptional regulator with XRE-family HTH domain
MTAKIEPFYAELGAKIQKTRAGKMTQAQLGQALNPSATRASIANIENGKQRVLVHTLMQLARAMDVGVQELLPSLGEPSPATTKDVARELKRKLNLGARQLRKLGIAPMAASARKQG